MEEHENKDIEPDPAGAEAGAPRDRQQGGLVADVAWGVMAGVVVVVLLVVVVEIGVVELLVVGFGGLSLLELLLLRLTGDPLHVTALGFWPLWRSIQQPCQWIRKVWWGAKGTDGFPREEICKAGTVLVALAQTPFARPLAPSLSGYFSRRDPRQFLGHVVDRVGPCALCPYSTWPCPNLGTSLPNLQGTNLLI